MQQNIIYNGQFRGNVLIAGCGKTYFMQKLAVNNFLGKIVKTEWVSSIQLSKIREVEIQSSFSCDVSFHYPQTLEAFDSLVEEFNLKSIGDTDSSINANNYDGIKKFDRLIVMDDVSGLTDRSNIFASFLTVTRKFGYHCVFCQKRKFGRKLHRKLIFLTFLQPLFLSKLSRRYCRLTLLEQQQDTYQLGLCG